MQYILLAILLALIVALPFYLKSSFAYLLGALAIGYLLSSLFLEEALFYPGSIPASFDTQTFRIISITLAFTPYLVTAVLTKGKAKKGRKRLFSLMIIPSIIVLSWKLLLQADSTLAYELRESEILTSIEPFMLEVTLLGFFAYTIYLFLDRRRPKIEAKKGKKKK